MDYGRRAANFWSMFNLLEAKRSQIEVSRIKLREEVPLMGYIDKWLTTTLELVDFKRLEYIPPVDPNHPKVPLLDRTQLEPPSFGKKFQLTVCALAKRKYKVWPTISSGMEGRKAH